MENDEARMRKAVPLHNIMQARANARALLQPEVEALEKTPTDVAVENHKRKKFALAELHIADALKDLEEGTEDSVSPMTGEATPKRMSQKSKKDNMDRMATALALQDVALGIPSKLTARMDDVNVSIHTEIKEVVEVRPSSVEIEAYEAETMKAIMPDENDLIEGEIE